MTLGPSVITVASSAGNARPLSRSHCVFHGSQQGNATGRYIKTAVQVVGLTYKDLPLTCPGNRTDCAHGSAYPNRIQPILFVQHRNELKAIAKAINMQTRHLCEVCLHNYSHVHADNVKRCTQETDTEGEESDVSSIYSSDSECADNADNRHLGVEDREESDTDHDVDESVSGRENDPNHRIPVPLIAGDWLPVISRGIRHICRNCVDSGYKNFGENDFDLAYIALKNDCPRKDEGEAVVAFLPQADIEQVMEGVLHVCRFCVYLHTHMHVDLSKPSWKAKECDDVLQRLKPPSKGCDPSDISVVFFAQEQIEEEQQGEIPLSVDIAQRQPHRHDPVTGPPILCGPYDTAQIIRPCPYRKYPEATCLHCIRARDRVKHFPVLLFQNQAQMDGFIRNKPHICMNCIHRTGMKRNKEDELYIRDFEGIRHVHLNFSVRKNRCGCKVRPPQNLNEHDMCAALFLERDLNKLVTGLTKGVFNFCPDCIHTKENHVVIKNKTLRTPIRFARNPTVTLIFVYREKMHRFLNKEEHICGACAHQNPVELTLAVNRFERQCGGPRFPEDTSPAKNVSHHDCDPQTITTVFCAGEQAKDKDLRITVPIMRSQPHIHEDDPGSFRFCGPKYPYLLQGDPPECISMPFEKIALSDRKCPYFQERRTLQCSQCTFLPHREREFTVLLFQSQKVLNEFMLTRGHVCMHCVVFAGHKPDAVAGIPHIPHFNGVVHVHVDKSRHMCTTPPAKDLDRHDVRAALVVGKVDPNTGRFGMEEYVGPAACDRASILGHVCANCVHYHPNIVLRNTKVRKKPPSEITCVFTNEDKINTIRSEEGHVCGSCSHQGLRVRAFTPKDRLQVKEPPMKACDPLTITTAFFSDTQYPELLSTVLPVDMNVILKQPHVHEDSDGSIRHCGANRPYKVCKGPEGTPECMAIGTAPYVTASKIKHRKKPLRVRGMNRTCKAFFWLGAGMVFMASWMLYTSRYVNGLEEEGS